MLIDKGEINVKEMRALRITINDLMEQLRIGGAPSINDVDFAVMESNGELSIIQKAEKRPLTAKDASIAADLSLIHISFPLNLHFGTLAVGLGSFPFDYGTYLS